MSSRRRENEKISAASEVGHAINAAQSRDLYSEVAGLLLLALALLFNAILLWPEARIERVPVNDLPFQIEAAHRLGQSISHAEPFLDPWVAQWSLGFPLWRIYQPLPHLLAAFVMFLSWPFASPAASFAAFYYLLLVLLPASVYVGARLAGMRPLAAGFAAILILAPSEMGDFSRYGLSYGAFTWRGSGLFTELVALELMVPTLGLVARAVDRGIGRTMAAVALAVTALSHIFFGYIAFVSTLVWALTAPAEDRRRNLVRAMSIAAKALLLLAWFLVPMVLAGAEVNRSRWDPPYKFDSYGAGVILGELFSGRLFDFMRPPVLTLMIGIGVLVAVFEFSNSIARRLVVLTAVWLGLYFGRETWGHLLIFAGIPNQFHLHRLESAFELFAILLAAYALERIVSTATRAQGLVPIAIGAILGGAILLIALDRVEFLRLNTKWGEANLAAFEHDRSDLEAALVDVQAILKQRPGRVSAGKAAEWGATFNVGEAHVYSFLTRYGFDQASYLYHTISLTSDYMVLRNENDLVHEDSFGIRAIVTPATMKLPANFQRRGLHGRFAVYEVSPEGYFSLVDIGASYDGQPATWFDPISRWLQSWMMHGGEVIALNSGPLPGVPAITRWQRMPDPAVQFMTPRGRVVAESKIGETYRATIDAQRQCYALIKITYFPSLVATVDGRREPLIRVFPDFGAIPLSQGRHQVEVSYQPGPLKPILFVLGIALFVLVARRPAFAGAWQHGEQWLDTQIAALGEFLTTDRAKIALAMALLILLFTRAMFRGQLINGHDSLEYPPRLTEFAKVIGEHQIPPVWAPDLSAGHGQPLFEFAPPLAYAAALPFFKAGMGLADSLQFSIAILFAFGALAVYLIGRRLSFSRFASLGAAAAWLFAPYQALDLYVSVRFAEACALAVTPVALLGLIISLDEPSTFRIALAAGAVALIPLAHNVVALLMFPVFAAIVAVRAVASQHRLRTAAAGTLVMAGGLALSAFFWLPAIAENAFVKTTDVTHNGFWTYHIIRPFQLLWSPWGFGISLRGPLNGISYSLGLVHLALAITGVIIGLCAVSRVRRLDALVFAGAAIGGAILATDWTWFVWAHLPPLQYLGYPWRTLCLPALFMPLLALFAFERIGPKLTCLAIVLIVLFNLTHAAPKGYLTFDDEYYYPKSVAQNGLNTTTHEEYEPRWVKLRLRYTGNGLIVPASRMSVRTLSWTSTEHEYSVSAPARVQVMESTNYFPGWTVLLDGRETVAMPMAPFGLLSFYVPAGQHNISVELRPTRVRRLGLMTSLLALLVLLILAAVDGFIRWRTLDARQASPTSSNTPAQAAD